MTPICLHCGTIPIAKIDFDRLESENQRMRAALTTIRRGDYDNAHDCFAASQIAARALANVERRCAAENQKGQPNED